MIKFLIQKQKHKIIFFIIIDFRDPVCVLALVISSLLVLLCLYARKLYEFTEFGKADTKLELMSNIMLSDSPTDSQSGSRHFGSSMSILPGIIGLFTFILLVLFLVLIPFHLGKFLSLVQINGVPKNGWF